MKPARLQPVRVLFMDHVARMSGAEQSLADLVAGLSQGPVEPIVVLPNDGPLATELRAHGVLVRMVPMSRRMLETSRTTLARAPFVALMRLGAFLAAAVRVWRLIREVRPDVVHTNTLKMHLLAVLPCKAARVPLVWHVRDILPPGWLRRAMVACARFVNVIIVPSRAVAEGFRGHRAVYRKLRLIPNGVRVDEFAEASKDRSLREMLGVNASDPVIGIVGRIAPWKGQDVFLRSAAMLAQRHPRAHFAVIGAVLFPENDTPYEHALYRMASDLGIADRVSFLGWQPAPEAMAACDIVVHASQQPEPFGRTIVEAMATGKPVVAAAGGAVSEILPPAAGFIVPPSRPELLADALDRLLCDKKLRKRMGEAGSAIAASFFPVARTVSSVGQLYRGLAARNARKRRKAARRMSARKAQQRRRQQAAQPHAAMPERALVWPRTNGDGPGPAAPKAPHAPARAPRNGNGNGNGSRGNGHRIGSQNGNGNGHRNGNGNHGNGNGHAPARDDVDWDAAQRWVRLEGDRDEPRAPRPAPYASDGPVASVAVRTDLEPRVRRAPARRAPTVALRIPRPVVAGAAEVAIPITFEPVAIPQALPRRRFDRKPVYDVLKRALDLTIALAVLIVGLPVWLTIAVLIKLESHGPVLHRGTVHGKGCAPFTYFKFRSMRIDGDDKAHRRFIERYVRENGGHEHEGEVVYKLMGDDRVTSIGRWIRRFSLDEVPQLLNVLRGEMSIVGPRPPLDYEYEHYDERAKARMVVKPGITGMQQVWHRHTASFEDKLALDLKYIDARSTWLDLKLIIHSFKAAVSGH
jgi:lipopolysaccharide/colanic/teichoic acid biosynthesis glycosyltransferase/glycosyltransferase involved in cell wall biosynthesis